MQRIFLILALIYGAQSFSYDPELCKLSVKQLYIKIEEAPYYLDTTIVERCISNYNPKINNEEYGELLALLEAHCQEKREIFERKCFKKQDLIESEEKVDLFKEQVCTILWEILIK